MRPPPPRQNRDHSCRNRRHDEPERAAPCGPTRLQRLKFRQQRGAVAGDTLARLGGDEFTVLMRGNPNPRDLQQFIDRLMQAFATPFALPDTDGVRVTLGVSIGVAAHPPLPALVDELLTRADHAMYEAKRGGKGCVHYAVPAPV
eukprot:gene44428-55252_t